MRFRVDRQPQQSLIVRFVRFDNGSSNFCSHVVRREAEKESWKTNLSFAFWTVTRFRELSFSLSFEEIFLRKLCHDGAAGACLNNGLTDSERCDAGELSLPLSALFSPPHRNETSTNVIDP